MQVRSFFLSISLTMFLALLQSWDTRPPYCYKKSIVFRHSEYCQMNLFLDLNVTWTVVELSSVVWRGIPSLVMMATPLTPELPCKQSRVLTCSRGEEWGQSVSPGFSPMSASPLLPSGRALVVHWPPSVLLSLFGWLVTTSWSDIDYQYLLQFVCSACCDFRHGAREMTRGLALRYSGECERSEESGASHPAVIHHY